MTLSWHAKFELASSICFWLDCTHLRSPAEHLTMLKCFIHNCPVLVDVNSNDQNYLKMSLFWDWLLFLQTWVKVNIWKTRKLYIIKPLFVCSLETSLFSKLASMKMANLKILTKQNYFGLYFEIYVKILTLFKISDFCYITIFRG